MGLAQAAQTVTLQAFLDYQFTQAKYNEKKRKRSTKFWWILVSTMAAILIQLESLNRFHIKNPVLIVVMGCFFIVFLLSFTCCDYEKMIGNVRAAEAHIRSRRVEVGQAYLRSLWGCMFIVSLVSASGSTLFLLEASTLHDRTNLAAILLLDNVVRFMEFMLSEASSLLIRKIRERKPYNQQKMELLRIGIGIWCCVLCCGFAMANATRRKNDDKMSVYWLTPQFVLLGLMGGLAKEGFQSLYESQAPPRYGSPVAELAKGGGALLTTVCIFIFSGRRFEWFRNNLDSSSLDKYYNFLAVLSAVNLLVYCLVAFRCIGASFLPQEDLETGLVTHASAETVIGSHAPPEKIIGSYAPEKKTEGRRPAKRSTRFVRGHTASSGHPSGKGRRAL